MGQKRPYQRYKVHVDGKVKNGGITTDFERRKEEHKKDYPDSIIRKLLAAKEQIVKHCSVIPSIFSE